MHFTYNFELICFVSRTGFHGFVHCMIYWGGKKTSGLKEFWDKDKINKKQDQKMFQNRNVCGNVKTFAASKGIPFLII